MAQSDDLTTYAQTWREAEQGQYNPAQPAYNGGDAQQQQAYPPHTGFAEQQPTHNAGLQNTYDTQAPASYDAAPAGQQYQQPSVDQYAAFDGNSELSPGHADAAQYHQNQPVAYQGDPVNQPYETQPGLNAPMPQTYGEAPQGYSQVQGAAGDPYPGQVHVHPGHEQAAVVYADYAPQPANTAQYGTAQQHVEPSYTAAQPDPYASQAGGHTAGGTPLQYEGASGGAYAEFSNQPEPAFGESQPTAGFQVQPQPTHYQPEIAGHDAYAFPQGGGDPVTGQPFAQGGQHAPQIGGAYLDPAAFSQGQAMADTGAFPVQQPNPAAVGGHYDPVTQPDPHGHGQQQGFDQRFGQAQGYDQRFEQPDQGFYDDTMQGSEIGAVVSAEAAAEPTRSRRGLIVIGALVAAIGIGGALGFAYKYSNDGGTKLAGNPPMIKANKDPSKEAPKNAGGKTFANQQKSIYTKLETNRASERSTTRLVPREERVAGQDGVSLRSSTSGRTNIGGTRITSLQSGQRVNVPGVRKVRTLKVNPDGSFAAPVSGSGDSFSIPGISIGSVPAVGSSQPATIPARKTTGIRKKVTASLPKASVSIPKPKAATPPKRVASLAPVTSSGLGFVVQVSARRTRIDALAAFADLQQRHSGALNAKQPDIQEVDLGTRGKWYRVRIGPPGSKNAAYNLCNKLKKSGLKDCIVKSY